MSEEPSGGDLRSAVLLTSPAFVLALALLVLNDWVLKATVGGWLTGKLSDFAGIFAFSIFAAAVLPRRRNAVFVATTLGFLLWKSPVIDGALAAWNALGWWPLSRVIDYSDWIALIVLIPAYRLVRRHESKQGLSSSPSWRRVVAVTTAGLAVVAFTATSVPPPRYDLNDPTEHRVPASSSHVRRGLIAIGRYVSDVTRNDTGDTLLIYIRQPPERLINVTFELRQTDSAATIIRLLDVSSYAPEPNADSVRRAFREQVLEPLREWIARSREQGR